MGIAEEPPPWVGALVHQGSEAAAAFDGAGTIVYANEAAARILTTPVDALVGTNVVELLHPDDLSRAGANIAGVAGGARPRPGLMRLRQGDGTYQYLEIAPAAIDLPDPPDGPGPLTMVTVRDNQLAEAHWQFLTAISSGQPFHQCLETLAIGLSNDVDGDLLVAFDASHGREVAGLLPPPFAGVTASGELDETPGTPWATALATGEPTWTATEHLPGPVRAWAAAHGREACVVVPATDPGSTRAALLVAWVPTTTMADIVLEALQRRPRQAVLLALERRHDLARLEHLAHHDGLTGLANRERWFAELTAWTERRQPFGVVYLDLDRFKPVNDSLGHAVGDSVLAETARRLEAAAGRHALVARIGGDEFVVALRGVDEAALDALAGRLVAAVSEPLDVDGRSIRIGASAGCARSDGTQAVDGVVARADGALYAAKRAGSATVDVDWVSGSEPGGR